MAENGEAKFFYHILNFLSTTFEIDQDRLDTVMLPISAWALINF